MYILTVHKIKGKFQAKLHMAGYGTNTVNASRP